MNKWMSMGMVLVLAMFVVSGVWAQDAAKGKEQGKHDLIKQADANNDGKVTFDEMKVARPKITQERFKELDKNGDGVLTEADKPFPAPKGPQGQGNPGNADPKQRFETFMKKGDANNDGKVTPEEAKAAFPKMTDERFKTMDKNKDGAITKDDAPKPPAQANAAGKPDTAGKPGKPGEKLGAKIRQSDADNDGKVTFEEAKKGVPELTQEQFKKFDKNGDGVVSKDDHKSKL